MKRYRTTHKGRLISITKEERDQLLKRFDPRNFKRASWLSYQNKRYYKFVSRTSCALCDKYNPSGGTFVTCYGCTFNKFHDGFYVGCIKLLYAVIGEGIEALDMEAEKIEYLKEDKKEAEEALHRICEFIKSFK